jgi:hypothetical protein
LRQFLRLGVSVGSAQFRYYPEVTRLIEHYLQGITPLDNEIILSNSQIFTPAQIWLYWKM